MVIFHSYVTNYQRVSHTIHNYPITFLSLHSSPICTGSSDLVKGHAGPGSATLHRGMQRAERGGALEAGDRGTQRWFSWCFCMGLP